jgi:hypothetical protein
VADGIGVELLTPNFNFIVEQDKSEKLFELETISVSNMSCALLGREAPIPLL